MSESTKLNYKDKIGKLIYGKKYETKNQTQKQTVQDLLSYDEITESGIVRASSAYFAIIEVSQINSHLLDFNESSSVWFSFRTMLNSINIRHSFILQSHFYDVTDFVKSFETRSKALNNLTNELEEAREDALDYYMDFSEERNREQRGYIMFRFNPSNEGLEIGLSTGNAKLDDFFTKLKSKSNTDDEESRSVAISMLEEVCDLAHQLLYTIGCPSMRLNREGVLEYMYSVVNRDLTVHQRLSDALSFGMFNTQKESQTPSIIVNAVDSILSEEIYTEYYINNNNTYNDEPFINNVFVNSEVSLNKSEHDNFIDTDGMNVMDNPEPPKVENDNNYVQIENDSKIIPEKTINNESISTNEMNNVVDFKEINSNNSDANEKTRNRRSEARKRKKERARAEKLREEEIQAKLDGTGSE